MPFRTIQLQLGTGAVIAAAFLILYAIPVWVSAPSNVPKIVLSPVFWPYVLAGCTAVVGLGLIASGLRAVREREIRLPDDGGLFRMLAMAAMMLATMWIMPVLGMVPTCSLIFIVTALLVKARHPVAVVATAILAPLVLYAFFAHVAGVAIPQGDYLVLP